MEYKSPRIVGTDNYLLGVFYKLGLNDFFSCYGASFELSSQPRSELRGKKLMRKMPIRAKKHQD